MMLAKAVGLKKKKKLQRKRNCYFHHLDERVMNGSTALISENTGVTHLQCSLASVESRAALYAGNKEKCTASNE